MASPRKRLKHSGDSASPASSGDGSPRGGGGAMGAPERRNGDGRAGQQRGGKGSRQPRDPLAVWFEHHFALLDKARKCLSRNCAQYCLLVAVFSAQLRFSALSCKCNLLGRAALHFVRHFVSCWFGSLAAWFPADLLGSNAAGTSPEAGFFQLHQPVPGGGDGGEVGGGRSAAGTNGLHGQ